MHFREHPSPSTALDWQEEICSESCTFLFVCGFWAQNAAIPYWFCPFLREIASLSYLHILTEFLYFHFCTTWWVSSVLLSPGSIDVFAAFLKLPVGRPPPCSPRLHLWLPWKASQLSPPQRLFRIFSESLLWGHCHPFPRLGLFIPFVYMTRGNLCSCWGQCDKQPSGMCCFKSLGQWASLTCIFVYFQALIFHWKYSQWDFWGIYYALIT